MNIINIFTKENSLVKKDEIKDIENDILRDKKILWIDLLRPNKNSIDHISQKYKLDIPDEEERNEIEDSARYWEDNTSITINTYFLVRARNGDLVNESITFILRNNILFTIRYSKFKTFDEIEPVILASPKDFQDGFDVLTQIFETRVEKDADLLEFAAKDSRQLRKKIFNEELAEYDNMLEGLSIKQELNMSVRDSLFDKRRAITAILKSTKAENDLKKKLTIILKDINSLIEFANSNMNALDNIQTILTNQINIEQNKTIKLFTVVTVAMMPPTLIGTIYGMNFEHMPELSYKFSYPIVLVIMILSTIGPIIYFKKKGWL